MNNALLPKAYEIINIVHETEIEYTFRVATDIKATHGQFVQVSIPKVGEAPISVSDYSHEEGWLDLTIRKVGLVTNHLFELKVGDKLFLRGPYGNIWPVNKLKDKNVVIIAGGTGVAPIKSLTNMLYNNDGFAKSVNIIAGFKDENSVLFKDTLNDWKQKFNTIYTLDNSKYSDFETGLVTKFVHQIPFDKFGDKYEVIIVGPPIMMHFGAIECLKNGVTEDKIWVSFERKMSCAIGKCGHCRIDETYVCLHGPVFNYTKAKNMID